MATLVSRRKEAPVMGVMLQAFYWDCLNVENREHGWWTFIKSKPPATAEAGFTAFWPPPANKAAGWKAMGYDAYDYLRGIEGWPSVLKS